VDLSTDFHLWLYRERAGLSWAALTAQPRWRTQRDVQYLRLENLAQAWHAAQTRRAQRAAERDRSFTDFQARARAALGRGS
jgi:hypothetical protein